MRIVASVFFQSNDVVRDLPEQVAWLRQFIESNDSGAFAALKELRDGVLISHENLVSLYQWGRNPQCDSPPVTSIACRAEYEREDFEYSGFAQGVYYPTDDFPTTYPEVCNAQEAYELESICPDCGYGTIVQVADLAVEELSNPPDAFLCQTSSWIVSPRMSELLTKRGVLLRDVVGSPLKQIVLPDTRLEMPRQSTVKTVGYCETCNQYRSSIYDHLVYPDGYEGDEQKALYGMMNMPLTVGSDSADSIKEMSVCGSYDEYRGTDFRRPKEPKRKVASALNMRIPNVFFRTELAREIIQAGFTGINFVSTVTQ